MRENYVVRRWNNVFYWDKEDAYWVDYFQLFRRADGDDYGYVERYGVEHQYQVNARNEYGRRGIDPSSAH